MPHPGLLHPDPLPLQQATADPHLHRRYSQFCLSLCGACGASGSWCAQGLFEPPEHLWRVWSLILNVILPHLPSCWGFSLGRGVSPHSRYSATRPPRHQIANIHWIIEKAGEFQENIHLCFIDYDKAFVWITMKIQLIWKDFDAGKDWRWEEKGTTEDEMIGWHHRCDGHEFE